MSTKQDIATESGDWPCTEKCHFVEHGNLVCDIGTQGDDRYVVSKWELLCRNYASVRDEFGRFALHVAASTPNYKAVDWLVKKDKSMLNAKDYLSGYTPLHQSIFFGQLLNARNLIAAGASLTSSDNEGLNPIELILADRLANLHVTKKFKVMSDPTELYVWGNNDNFNLGTDNQTARRNPELLDRFRPRKPTSRLNDVNFYVSHVNLQTFHSVFLGQNGEVFTCGVGNSGRLGIGEKETVAVFPHRVSLKDRCIQVAAGTNHTVFLLANGNVLSCGSNENFTLGHKGDPPPDKLFYPRLIDTLRTYNITEIRASTTHSVFCTKNRLYTCGANDGQLGHLQVERYVIAPRVVTSVGFSSDDSENKDSHFSHIECNELATVVRNRKGMISILYRNSCHRIQAQQFAVAKIVAIGGRPLSTSLAGDQTGSPLLTLFLLTHTGSVVIWREDVLTLKSGQKPTSPSTSSVNGSFTQVIWDLGRTLLLKDISVTSNTILAIASGGEAFIGHWKAANAPFTTPNINSPEERAKKQAENEEVTDRFKLIESKSTKRGKGKREVMACTLEHLKLKRISNIYAAEAIACDPKANNFAVIQRYHNLDFIEVPSTRPSTIHEDLRRLFDEVHLDDIIHDVVFQVENPSKSSRGSFPAHKFVIATSCPQLYVLVKEAELNNPNELPASVTVFDVEPIVFEQVLMHIYTASCDLLLLGSELFIGSNIIQPDTFYRLVTALARQLKMENLAKSLNQVVLEDGIIIKKSVHKKPAITYGGAPRIAFQRYGDPDLTDVTIISSDNHHIRAHRCILVARSEYFNMMMCTGMWQETTSRKINLSLRKITIEVILDFLYAEKSSSLRELDPESIQEVFMATDLLGLEELRSHVESALVGTISHKTVADLLTKSILNNANQLRDSCFNFISLNLASLLENRHLDDLDDDIMAQVGQYYRDHHERMMFRYCRPVPWNWLPKSDMCIDTEIDQPCVEFDKFMESYDIFEQHEFEVTKLGKSNKIKTKRIRHRSRTLSSDGELDPIKSTNTMQLPRESPTCTAKYPASQPLFANTVKEVNAKAQLPKEKAKATPIPAKEVTLNNLHFPSLSPIVSVADNFQKLTVSPKNPGAKKKIKWTSLSNEGAGQQLKVKEVKASPIPTNPWNKLPLPQKAQAQAPSLPMNATQQLGFKDIVKEEQEMKEHTIRATEKSLRLTQIEEMAIQELERRYTGDDVRDGIEVIKIERIDNKKYASPTWPRPHSSGKSSSHPSTIIKK